MNAYGLPRTIPADVKRKVRQACGFGCVICGLGIVQYEHVDPEYHMAKTHDPEKIVLLCPGCHAKVTTKQWSKARVKLAMRSPKCKQVGYANEFFDFCDGHPHLTFGGLKAIGCSIPIEVQGYPLFSIEAPEEEGEPFRLSGHFTDANGDVSLVIKDNEWMAGSELWDVEVIGSRITIREGVGRIHLVLRADPPYGLTVEKVDMWLGGYRFLANGEDLKVYVPGGGELNLSSCLAMGCRVGLSLS